uniref:anion permease n=1 Tax=Halalkalibacter akibai TaxID=1411 RepID=UPI00054E04E5
MTYSHSQWLGLYLGPFVASLLYLIPGITQLPNDARSVLAITTLVVIWWITEPIPMAFTSLLPFILLPFFSDISYYSTAISYFDPLIL